MVDSCACNFHRLLCFCVWSYSKCKWVVLLWQTEWEETLYSSGRHGMAFWLVICCPIKKLSNLVNLRASSIIYLKGNYFFSILDFYLIYTSIINEFDFLFTYINAWCIICRYGRKGIYRNHIFGSPYVIVVAPEACKQVFFWWWNFQNGLSNIHQQINI